MLDLDTWKNPLQDHGALTKLHGSVDWSRATNGQILVGNPQYKGDHKRHVIIYPGFKGAPQSEEIILFHNYFSRAVSEAALLIFIGFAFRDEYLNALIADSLRPDSKVLIINPANSLPNLPLPDDMVVYEKLPFDSFAVERCLRMAHGIIVIN